MKNLKVEIFVNDTKIGEADYMTLNIGSSINVNPISFSNFRVTQNEYRLFQNMPIEISISYRDDQIYFLTVQTMTDIVLEDSQKMQLNTEIDLSEDSYNQEVIDILGKWDCDLNLDWRILDEKGKSNWLTACVIHRGLPRELTTNQDIVIDCSLIKSELDFFCLLGETLVGKKGYIGRGVDSFEDCMLDIRNNEKYKNSIITFKHSKVLKDVFFDYEDFNLILKSFVSKHFSIELN